MEEAERDSDKKKTPRTAIFDTAGQGIKAVFLCVVFIALFFLPNLACTGFAIAGLIKVEITRWVILYFALIILAAAAACVVALYFTYDYFLIDSIRIIYSYLTPLFRMLCGVIAKHIAGGNTGIIKKGYDWSENIAEGFQKTYNRAVPRLVRAGIRFILSLIPFADIMYHLSIDTKTTDTGALGTSIYTQLDAYITTRIFEENTMKWILWFLPLNFGLQGLLMYLLYK
jgi:hypothetical protein